MPEIMSNSVHFQCVVNCKRWLLTTVSLLE